MMKRIRYLVVLLGCCLASGMVTAQDSAEVDANFQKPVQADTGGKRSFDSTLFADENVLTNSDYLVRIQKVFQTLNKVPVLAAAFYKLNPVREKLEESGEALATIRERMGGNPRSLNIRNLQMFRSLLVAIDENGKGYMAALNQFDDRLDNLKKEILELRKDTAIRHIYRDTALRRTFSAQLKALRVKWRATDSLVRFTNTSIDNFKAIASDNTVNVTELMYQTDQELDKTGPAAFGKQGPYLWEKDTARRRDGSLNSVSGNNRLENKIVRYYLMNTRTQRAWLFFTGIIFLVWVMYNYRSLKRRDRLDTIDRFHFQYISAYPVSAAVIFMLSLAPLFDFNAPAIYIEGCQFLLMLILTVLFRKRWPRPLFICWCVTVFLFLLLSLTRLAGLHFFIQRWCVLFINAGAVCFGIYFWSRLRKQKYHAITFIAVAIYVFFNLFAIASNLAGRITLNQIFGYTAVYAFAQMLGLPVFVRLLEEACLLQIQGSRIRNEYPDKFDSGPILSALRLLTAGLAILIWSITFTNNLNIFSYVYGVIHDFLALPRTIGSIYFSFGGILLFLGIIWLANFLQKYIGYFFGDTGDEAGFNNKGQRSRLMITRLVLLISGFLIAVAASGLPVDKITVVLGALGVGIGLGLQGIVNNFVSGVILIFDRPLRIGDTVEVGDKKGRVKEISIRSSTLLTAEGAEVIIPNGDLLSHNIVNWTLSNNHIRIDLPVTVDKVPDPEALQQAFLELMKKTENVLQERAPEILFTNIKGNAVQLDFLFWCDDVTRLDNTRSEARKAIYNLLREKEMVII